MARFFLLALWGLFLCSCSLNYQSEVAEVAHVPELVFSQARYVNYQEGRVSMVLEAAVLEQYQEDGALYGSQVHFSTYNDEGKLSAEGSCQLISADSSNEQYALLGQVEIKSFEENLILQTQSLSWDGKIQQLVTGLQDTLEITRGATQEEATSTSIELVGSGFSASGVTGNFQFASAVSGKIYTATTEGEAP